MNAENQRLQAAMQAATIVASKDAQSKDKRIHHLERKVITILDSFISRH
jgi:polyhydroxyalkanoate synthesis regulator phasin